MNNDLFQTHLDDGELSKIFADFNKNSTRFKGYKFFEEEYTLNNLQGADFKQFKDRLTTFFNSCVGEENQVEKDDDPLYQNLCLFNFKHQAEHFDKFVTSNKPLIPFIIRGQADYGQTWLCNKLIYQYQQKYPLYHKSIIVDLRELSCDFKGLLYYLGQFLNVNTTDYSNAKSLCDKAKLLMDAIKSRLVTQPQFIVIKNAHSFADSDFYNILGMLKAFNIHFKAAKSKHKCILLFVENEPAEYKRKHCICSKTTHAFDVQMDTLKFIDLHNIEPIISTDVKDWLTHKDLHEKYRNTFNGTTDIDKSISDCNGNPYLILQNICEKICDKQGTDKQGTDKQDINFTNYENQWLKY